MKGAYFQKPLEWQIDVVGESWSQGDRIKGELQVKNLGTEEVPLATAGVQLAYAQIKKVHARDELAFKLTAQDTFSGQTIRPGQSLQLPFEFLLPVNCAITDKKASYYVTYGLHATEANLQLHVTPRKLFNDITKLCENFQRFKCKEVKAIKDAVEYKLIPPGSREYAHIEALHLAMQLNGEELVLACHFKIKVLDTNSITTKVAKAEKIIHKSLQPREYSLGRDLLNQQGVLRALEDVMVQVKMTGL